MTPENSVTPDNIQALLIAALVFLPGTLSAMTWRKMAVLRQLPSREDRVGAILVWSAINGALILLMWTWIDPRLSALLKDGGSLVDRSALAGLTTVIPFGLALFTGYFSRGPKMRDWMQRNGIIHPEASPPWDRLTSPRGDGSPGFRIYFTHEGHSYRCESARTSDDQILGRKVRMYVEENSRWEPVPEITGVLLINFGERVLFLEEDQPI